MIEGTEETQLGRAARRRNARLAENRAAYEKSGHQVRTDVKWGVCKQCSRFTLLWLPASLCERDLLSQGRALMDLRAATAEAEAKMT